MFIINRSMNAGKFIAEQKEALHKTFDDGLQSSSKAYDEQIRQLAMELNCTVDKVKVSILIVCL